MGSYGQFCVVHCTGTRSCGMEEPVATGRSTTNYCLNNGASDYRSAGDYMGAWSDVIVGSELNE